MAYIAFFISQLGRPYPAGAGVEEISHRDWRARVEIRALSAPPVTAGEAGDLVGIAPPARRVDRGAAVLVVPMRPVTPFTSGRSP
jgi:hypothetical protein